MWDADRYYTPPEIAASMMEGSALIKSGRSFLDPTCGEGVLLSAVSRIHRARGKYFGIDLDCSAIRRVRRANPHWVISSGDIFSDASVKLTDVFRTARCDVIVGNPPFSHNGKKRVSVDLESGRIECSVAMACILRSFHLFKPKIGMILVVPESLLHAQADNDARRFLEGIFELSIMGSLGSSTFQGARARSAIIELRRTKNFVVSEGNVAKNDLEGVSITLTRGALPVHLATRLSHGSVPGAVPFVHSTDLSRLNGEYAPLYYTNRTAKGLVSGSVILFSRVGSPSIGRVVLSTFNHPVQMSDCLISIHSASENDLEKVMRTIEADWASFEAMYCGTGARYVTMSRLKDWFRGRGAEVVVA
ncbi:SAM-dependent DNA methyltransferase [Stenotrophomonas maltophilia]|nr:SAM-dependent DNA methyltransferase [Stenotrophomonas maltophilia]MBH1436172.1 SAM-dependent DNA methyltransferase [Stenotrophomonas maltophilia]